MLHQVDLHVEPNEASDLCEVREPGLLEAQGWDAAFLTVLDEAPVEDAVAMLGHAADAALTEGWSTHRLRFDAGADAGRSDDAEAVTVRDDTTVYVLGSHYGAKEGPLQPRRQWVARFELTALSGGLEWHHLYVMDEESRVQMRFLLVE